MTGICGGTVAAAGAWYYAGTANADDYPSNDSSNGTAYMISSNVSTLTTGNVTKLSILGNHYIETGCKIALYKWSSGDSHWDKLVEQTYGPLDTLVWLDVDVTSTAVSSSDTLTIGNVCDGAYYWSFKSDAGVHHWASVTYPTLPDPMTGPGNGTVAYGLRMWIE
jgi:hypothetical protein